MAKTLALVPGGLITYYAYPAHARTAASSLRSRGIGFGVITAWLVIAGIGTLVFGVPVLFGVLFESILTTVGPAAIVYSLYVR